MSDPSGDHAGSRAPVSGGASSPAGPLASTRLSLENTNNSVAGASDTSTAAARRLNVERAMDRFARDRGARYFFAAMTRRTSSAMCEAEIP